jgi:hypothetical protein
VAAVEGASEGGEEVGVPESCAGQVVGDGLDVLELEGATFPEGGELVDVQAPQQLVTSIDRRHVGGGEGQPQPGRGDALVEGLGELLDGQHAALDLSWGAAPHVHRLLGPAADAGAGVAEPVGSDQGLDEGGVGPLAVDEADLVAQEPG